MSPSHSALLAHAHAWQADYSPRAIALQEARHTAHLLQQFQAGAVDAETLRASLTGARSDVDRRSHPKGMALIPVVGVLSAGPSVFSLLGVGTVLRDVQRALKAAADDPSIHGIVLYVDSPGGQTRLVSETAQLVRAVREIKPVIAVVDGMAGSAAYWISSGASGIYATPSAYVGSIGVITERVSLARHLDREGIDVAVISAGKFKAEGHEALPITDDERRHLQALVDNAYGQFVEDVAAGRQVAQQLVRTGFGQGRLVSAKEAKALGMITDVQAIDIWMSRPIAAPRRIAAEHKATVTDRLQARRRALDEACGRVTATD